MMQCAPAACYTKRCCPRLSFAAMAVISIFFPARHSAPQLKPLFAFRWCARPRFPTRLDTRASVSKHGTQYFGESACKPTQMARIEASARVGINTHALLPSSRLEDAKRRASMRASRLRRMFGRGGRIRETGRREAEGRGQRESETEFNFVPLATSLGAVEKRERIESCAYSFPWCSKNVPACDVGETHSEALLRTPLRTFIGRQQKEPAFLASGTGKEGNGECKWGFLPFPAFSFSSR